MPLFLFLVFLPALWYKLLKRAQRQHISMTTSLLALSYALSISWLLQGTLRTVMQVGTPQSAQPPQSVWPQ